MDRSQIETALQQILTKNSALPIESIAAGDSLTEDLGFDSMALLMTLTDLEDRFGVSFPIEKVERLRGLCFDDLVSFVQRELTRPDG